MLIWWNSCPSCLPITSTATPAATGKRPMEIIRRLSVNTSRIPKKTVNCLTLCAPCFFALMLLCSLFPFALTHPQLLSIRITTPLCIFSMVTSPLPFLGGVTGVITFCKNAFSFNYSKNLPQVPPNFFHVHFHAPVSKFMSCPYLCTRLFLGIYVHVYVHVKFPSNFPVHVHDYVHVYIVHHKLLISHHLSTIIHFSVQVHVHVHDHFMFDHFLLVLQVYLYIYMQRCKNISVYMGTNRGKIVLMTEQFISLRSLNNTVLMHLETSCWCWYVAFLSTV